MVVECCFVLSGLRYPFIQLYTVFFVSEREGLYKFAAKTVFVIGWLFNLVPSASELLGSSLVPG